MAYKCKSVPWWSSKLGLGLGGAMGGGQGPRLGWAGLGCSASVGRDLWVVGGGEGGHR